MGVVCRVTLVQTIVTHKQWNACKQSEINETVKINALCEVNSLKFHFPIMNRSRTLHIRVK